jgi:hypothetical protein
MKLSTLTCYLDLIMLLDVLCCNVEGYVRLVASICIWLKLRQGPPSDVYMLEDLR